MRRTVATSSSVKGSSLTTMGGGPADHDQVRVRVPFLGTEGLGGEVDEVDLVGTEAGDLRMHSRSQGGDAVRPDLDEEHPECRPVLMLRAW